VHQLVIKVLIIIDAWCNYEEKKWFTDK